MQGMALLLHERTALKTRLLKALRSGHQIGIPEKYQAELKAISGKAFPATVEGLLEHLEYIESARMVKAVAAEQPAAQEPPPVEVPVEPAKDAEALIESLVGTQAEAPIEGQAEAPTTESAEVSEPSPEQAEAEATPTAEIVVEPAPVKPTEKKSKRK